MVEMVLFRITWRSWPHLHWTTLGGKTLEIMWPSEEPDDDDNDDDETSLFQ